jgi:hypothetical protein
MALIAQENFDSYTNGQTLGGLNGGSGWSGPWVQVGINTQTITNSQAQTGTLSVSPSGVTPNTATRSFTTGTGISFFEIYARSPGGFTSIKIFLQTSSGSSWFGLHVSGQVGYNINGGGFINTTTFTANTWYKLGLGYNASTGEIKMYLNDILQNTSTLGAASLTSIGFDGDNSSEFIDSISTYDTINGPLDIVATNSDSVFSFGGL